MKINRFFAVACTALFCNFAIAQTQNKVVLKVGDENVTLSDFEHIYKKNNDDVAITKEGLDEYMDLFVKFKLKVVEAESLGMDTASDFTRELAGYRKQLARPYLVDTELLDEIVHEAYARQQTEIRARHILVTVGENALPADTIRAWNRINKLKDRIEAGEDFTTVAKSKNGSDDPSVTQNGGDLGWFTAFKMVFPFEEAAYNTPLGEISDIVRTRFGYHFLEVTDKRDAKGEIQVAHILVRVSDTQNKTLLHKGKTEIDAVSALLKNGESFESLALKYSDDESSKSKGGVLQWFSSGKMVEEFENAAFSLENNGDVSEPFMTSYGWHIVKRLDYKEPASFEEVEKSLRKKVSRDKRAEVTKTSFIKKLKNEYTYRIFPGRVENLKNAISQIDSVFHKGYPLVHNRPNELNKTLFSIAGYNTTVGDFVEYANTVKKRDINLPSDMIIDELIKRISDEKLLAHENSRLEEKHNDFRLLINEYHDGILLFELTDEMV
ncbi:MAG: peptidylprolyl isomerase, partial [Bacteroidota bacterium]|nr:peptidylprolyl isomerase [Bacteroidota bacterium]